MVKNMKYQYDIQQAYADYQKTKSLKITAKKFGTTEAQLNYQFKINKLDTTQDLYKKQVEYVKSLPVEKLHQEYLELSSLRDLGKKYSVSPKIISKLFKDNKLSFVNRNYCNENFFEETNEAQLYFVGLIASDGCINDAGNSKSLNFCINPKDIMILEKLKELLESDSEIKVISYQQTLKNVKNPVEKTYHSARFNVGSNKLCESLERRFLITPRKSLTYEMPEWLINHPLVNFSLLGYMDGDGSISLVKKKSRKGKLEKPQARFQVLGSEKFVHQYAEILQKNILNLPVGFFKKGKIYMLYVSGNDNVAKICKFLYKDATIFLPRKKERADKIIADYDRRMNEEKTSKEEAIKFFYDQKEKLDTWRDSLPTPKEKIIKPHRKDLISSNPFFFSPSNTSAKQFYYSGYLLGTSAYQRDCRLLFADKAKVDEFEALGIFNHKVSQGLATSDVQILHDLKEFFGFNVEKNIDYKFTNYVLNSEYLKYFLKGRLDAQGRMVEDVISLRCSLDFAISLQNFLLRENLIPHPLPIKPIQLKTRSTYHQYFFYPYAKPVLGYFNDVKF